MVVKTGGRGPGHVARTPPGPAAAAMTLSGLSTAENSTAGTLIGVLGTVGTTGTPVYALDNNAGGRAALSGANLNRGATALDYATATFFDVTVSVTGVTPVITPTTFRIAVTPLVDTVPNAFSFTDATGVDLSTVSASNSITVSGINAPSAISVSGGEYEKNGSGTWTGSAGTVVNGDTVKVRGTSSASNSTAVNVVLTIGGVSDTYTITTVAAAGGPAFSFTPLAYYDETSVVQTAGAVSQWTDKGPNGIHLIQATGANQPAWTDWIGFDGVNDTLVSAPRDLSSKPALAAFARIETASGGANAAADGIFVMGGTAGDDYTGDGCIFFYDPGAAQLGMYRSTGIGTGVSYSADVRIGAVFDNAGPEWIYNKTTGVNNSSTLSNSPFSTTGQFVLGSRWNALDGRPGAFGQFRIKRLVLTDFVPSAGQLDEIWAWLTPPTTFSFTPLAYYDETSVVQTAGAVSQWTDKGPNGIHLKQATGAAQPAWNAGTGWTAFDGVNDCLITDAADLSAKPALCAFARVIQDPASLTGGILCMAPDSGPDAGLTGSIFWYRPSTANTVTCYRDSTGPWLTVTDGADVIIGAVHDRAGSEIVYNHTAGTSVSDALSNSAFASAGRFTLGGRSGPTGFNKMSVRRMILTDFVPTTTQLNEIWAWLAS